MKHATWMDLKGVMLFEKGQSQRVTQCMIPFVYHSQNDKIIDVETDQWLPGVRDDEWDEVGIIMKDQYEEYLCGNRIILNLDCSGGYKNSGM